jgi:predicted porin
MLAVAVATTLLAPAAFADSKNVDMYGVIAFGFMQDKPQEALDTTGAGTQWTVLNESRIGFRGSKELKNGPKFIWQIESGFLGPNGLTGAEWESGTLGTRDTFGGFEGGFGKVRFGRLLTPVGETLDWPYTNGGVGPIIEAAKVFDRWDDTNYVRHSNMFRWDSPAGGMIDGSVAYGRGDTSVADSSFYSAMANVKVSKAMLHFGLEAHTNQTDDSDTNMQMVGFEAPIVGGLSAYGVYVRGEHDDESAGDGKRDSWQAALVYGQGDWIFKLTHAAAGKLEIDGDEVDESEGNMTAVQALYLADPSAVFYARYVTASDYESSASVVSGYKNRLLIGLEYYF